MYYQNAIPYSIMCVCSCFYTSFGGHINTSYAYLMMWLMAAPCPRSCGGDQWFLTLVFNPDSANTSCIHIMQCTRCRVLAPGQCLLIQVPAI